MLDLAGLKTAYGSQERFLQHPTLAVAYCIY